MNPVLLERVLPKNVQFIVGLSFPDIVQVNEAVPYRGTETSLDLDTNLGPTIKDDKSIDLY